MSASDTHPTDGRRSRRGALGLLAAGGGAALAALLGRPERALADDGGPMILGAANRASSKTSIIGTVDADFAFSVENRSATAAGAAQFQTANPDGLALHVEGVTSLAADHAGYAANIFNPSANPQAGALFATGSGLAPVIIAISDAEFDPDADAAAPEAIAGESTSGVGVEGSGGLIGVNGASPGGIGVHGSSESDGTGIFSDGLGGLFENHGGGVGLGVVGRVAFGTVGAATLPTGESSVFVEDTRVRETSHITITPVSNPGGREMRWVERVPESGFTVHFSQAGPRSPAIDFTYFIAEHQEELKGG